MAPRAHDRARIRGSLRPPCFRPREPGVAGKLSRFATCILRGILLVLCRRTARSRPGEARWEEWSTEDEEKAPVRGCDRGHPRRAPRALQPLGHRTAQNVSGAAP